MTISGDAAFASATSKLNTDLRTLSQQTTLVRNGRSAIVHALQIQPRDCTRVRSAISAAGPAATAGDATAAAVQGDVVAVRNATARLRPQVTLLLQQINDLSTQSNNTPSDTTAAQELTTDRTAAQAQLVNINGAEAQTHPAAVRADNLAGSDSKIHGQKLPGTC
jgi:hypothetical protein